MELMGQRGFTLVDILGKASYEDSHIKGAISVPFDELEDHGWEILGGIKTCPGILRRKMLKHQRHHTFPEYPSVKRIILSIPSLMVSSSVAKESLKWFSPCSPKADPGVTITFSLSRSKLQNFSLLMPR